MKNERILSLHESTNNVTILTPTYKIAKSFSLEDILSGKQIQGLLKRIPKKDIPRIKLLILLGIMGVKSTNFLGNGYKMEIIPVSTLVQKILFMKFYEIFTKTLSFLKSVHAIIMIDIPNLRVGGLSTFFDNDLTYLHILQDVCILLSFISLTWDLLESLPPSSGDRVIGERLYGISLKTLILYAFTFTARLGEYFPFEYLCYDLASCSGFAFIFWIATFSWIYFNSVQQASALPEQSSERSGSQKIANMDTGRPVVLHVTVGITAILAYLFNYSHLDLTPRLFLWAWSHYLDGVAMLPQLWTLTKAYGNPYAVSRTVWIGVNLMALSKIFMLLNWAYLLYVAEMLDVLAVASGLFHLIVHGIFMITICVKTLGKKKACLKKSTLSNVKEQKIDEM